MKDKKILSLFSDDALRMNPKFSAQLKKDLLRKEQAMNKRSSMKWGVFALAPVAVMAVAAVMILGGLNWDGDGYKTPPSLKTQSVSAATLLSELENTSKNFNPQDHSFIAQTTVREIGPRYEACRVTGGLGVANETTKSYLYISKESDVEAVHYVSELPSGEVLAKQSFYDDTVVTLEEATAALESYRENPPAAEFLRQYEIHEQKPYTLISPEGEPLPKDEQFAPVQRNGREVYEFVIQLDQNQFTSDCPEVHKLVIDAKTKTLVDFRTYDAKPTEDNLITRSVTVFEYDNRGDAEALGALREAGFDE